MSQDLCSVCRSPLDVERPEETRMPCPNCGSMFRDLNAGVNERCEARDHMQVEARDTNKKIKWFDESLLDGQASSASLQPDGSISQNAIGDPPQGETLTLESCERLVAVKNKDKKLWGRPELIEQGEVDCLAKTLSEEGSDLRIQVVQASVDQSVYREWRKAGSHVTSSNESILAYQLRQAIEHKGDHLPLDSRRGLVLALNARRLPALAFDNVVAAFRFEHGLWAQSLGFSEIWVVGPTESMTWRLDDA